MSEYNEDNPLEEPRSVNNECLFWQCLNVLPNDYWNRLLFPCSTPRRRPTYIKFDVQTVFESARDSVVSL